MGDYPKCLVRLNDGWQTDIEAELLCFVPAATSGRVFHPIRGEAVIIYYTQDALVKLLSFDSGRIYQLPLNLVRIVEQFDED
jgi:hypothetical protein